jgi:hypothetical protein
VNTVEQPTVESNAVGDFARLMQASSPIRSRPSRKGLIQQGRVNLDQGDVKNGLGQLGLTLVKLLHELLERQAIRRIDAGSLSHAEIEKMGMILMNQAQEIERLRKEFGLEETDLNLDLGPLGKLL